MADSLKSLPTAAGPNDRSIATLTFVTVPELIMGTLMLVGVAINITNVIGRYLFGYAFFWAEEIMVFITIWGVFIGLAAITYKGDYLNMDLFSRAFTGRARLVLNSVIAITLLACCAFMIKQSFQVVTMLAQAGQVSVSASVPKQIPHAALLVGFILTVLAVIVRIRSYITGKF
jgi:TRAP-type C4-dicarboxylate transport system permease small subunit